MSQTATTPGLPLCFLKQALIFLITATRRGTGARRRKGSCWCYGRHGKLRSGQKGGVGPVRSRRVDVYMAEHLSRMHGAYAACACLSFRPYRHRLHPLDPAGRGAASRSWLLRTESCDGPTASKQFQIDGIEIGRQRRSRIGGAAPCARRSHAWCGVSV
jgi:hypothetical protein